MDKAKKLFEEYKDTLSGERWAIQKGDVRLAKAFAEKAVKLEDKIIAIARPDLERVQ